MPVLDTCILYDFLTGVHEAKEVIDEYPGAMIAAVSRYTIMREAQNLPPLIQQETMRFLNRFYCIDFSIEVCGTAARLSRNEPNLSDTQVQVLASAISCGDVLITRQPIYSTSANRVIKAY